MDQVVVSPCTDLGEVTSFYQANGYTCRVGETDTVLVGHRIGELVGAVRLAFEGGVLVLRGMQVETRFQRQGVGSALLGAAVGEIGGRECWCLPYGYLDDFYAGAGFCISKKSDAPGFLAERANQYIERGRLVVVMRRLALCKSDG